MNQWRRWPDDPQTLADPAWNWLAKALGMPALLATPPRALADITLPDAHVNAEPFIALLGSARVRQDAEARLRHAGDVLKARGGDLSDAPELVLLPRDEDDVLAILNLCAQAGVSACVFGAGNATHGTAQACIDMTGMTRLKSVDVASGLAEIEAGITGEELSRQLAARGLMLEDDFGFGTLGGRIALGTANWLLQARLATPRGMIVGLPQTAGSRGTLGAITAATVKIRALPAHPQVCGFVFPDFAAGLAALAQAQHLSIAHYGVQMSDAAETDFHHHLRAMERHPLLRWLQRPLNGAGLTVTFPNLLSRLRFALLARKLAGRQRRLAAPVAWRNLLLDRGVMVEHWRLPVCWSQVSALRSALSAALDQVTREHAPRPGAHGLVLSQVCNPRSDGADLVLTAIWPRLLNEDVAQAQAIREAAQKAILEQTGAVTRPASDIIRAIKLVLDPKGVLPA